MYMPSIFGESLFDDMFSLISVFITLEESAVWKECFESYEN